MLTGIHFLTTYACNFECDHCFLYCAPGSRGTFTVAQIRAVLDEAVRIGTIEAVFFEGGEPFLYYPLVLAGIDLARQRGFNSSVVTNAYWATSEQDAGLWLRPLHERGVTSISISDDPLHYGDAPGVHAARAEVAAGALGMAVKNMRTEPPTVQPPPPGAQPQDRPTIGGGVMFRGRAAEKLAADLPTRPAGELVTCPHEDLAAPGRVHVDCYGHVHLCQGLSIGNFHEVPLSQLVAGYDPQAHPIAGPLLAGGPAQLARQYGIPHEQAYVDECHFCYQVRLALIGRFAHYLAPRQVYGLE
jgi:hypothetical protein